MSVTCGRGDKKTAKGKRFNGSYGNARPRNKNKGRGPPRTFGAAFTVEEGQVRRWVDCQDRN
ncbi:hypothetical protein QJS10_CPA03g01887 [Acorus calamus]|uniref:30S ribosomal protein THX n=1 Tax=Acorus calamus TaxID=4465 RepID=A0AAV9F6X0_ACOCL|nr:hypothetical protein QJS10_CPA03g01887 [Acorus calamus]